MNPIDADIGKATGLVIDGNAASRAALAGMLRDCGVGNVLQANRAQDGRRWIEKQHFDIVVCDYVFHGETMNGQDLMDDLRLAHLLPLSTVVIMISAEAGHSKVAEAAEAALDAYLIKPHTAAGLRERLLQSRQRKRALRDVFALVEKQAFEEAAQLCQVRFETRGPAWLHAARIGAELWLRLGKAAQAQVLFDAILQMGAVPWARLGIARTQQERGNLSQARRTLESLLNEQPNYTDAYDVMSRVLLEQGLPDQALMASREAATRTPGSVARLVKLGLLAFFYGDAAEAGEALGQAARLGINSKAFDLQGLVLLGLLQFDRRDHRGLAQSWRSMVSAHEAAPGSARLRRFTTLLAAMKALLDRQLAEAVRLIHQMVGEAREPSFDFEAACNVLSLLSRVSRYEVQLESTPSDVDALARRFAVSRTTCELLVRAAMTDLGVVPLIKGAYAAICHEAEEAVSKTLAGRPGEAVALLLAAADKSLNGKLMDLAQHTLERHGSQIDNVQALTERARALHQRYRSYGTQVTLRDSSGVRTLGSLAKA